MVIMNIRFLLLARIRYVLIFLNLSSDESTSRANAKKERKG
tara:strand:- start:52 stop:174 length:123 start_codon:yes stop_codon:yes gene_type:complete